MIPNALNGYAWELLTSEVETLRDLDKALLIAIKASQLTGDKNLAILDTLGLAYFKNGKIQQAIDTQKKAISLLPANDPPDQRKEYENRLKEYEAALDEKE